MSDNQIQKPAGPAPAAQIIKIALLSLLVGVVLAAFGMTPWGFFHFLRDLFHDLFGHGIEALHRIAGYIVSGAMIVVPVWLILKFLSARKAG